MTTTEILTGIKNWVVGKLNLKQNIISDLADIRSGAQAGSTSVQPADIVSYFNNASYDSATHRINFYHGQTVKAYIDASPFIIDGMVDDVRIENGNLVIDFNTDSGKQDISIPLTDIFNPNNYYTKTQTDGLLGGKADKSTTYTKTEVDTAINQEKTRSETVESNLSESIARKQDTLTFDNTPTKGSLNPVTSNGIAEAIEAGLAEPYELVTVVATANKGTVTSVELTIYDANDNVLAQGVDTVSLRIKYDTTYKVGGARVNDYLTPAIQTFVADRVIRDVTVAYTYIERDVVVLDQSITDPTTMLSGDIQGDVIKEIRNGSHLYLGTSTTQEGDEEGTESICQLDDTDSDKYFDGTVAVLDGTEGDQWMKLPIFWWKIDGIGEPDEDGAYDRYSFSYATMGQPDDSWNKWEGDRNLLGAKEMKVVDDVGRSVSGGTSSGSFTQGQGNNYAAARNLGCQEVTWEWQWMMCMLFYAWYGNTDSQAVCGIGSNGYTRTLGVTDALGMTDTTPSQATSLTSARFWGLEAWWNCKTEWMGNVTSSNYVLTIKDMNTKQNRTVAGFIAIDTSYITRMKITEHGDFIPVAAGGTSTTSYCDSVRSSSGSRVVGRSDSGAGAGGGVACVSARNASSTTFANLGSRLAFNGNVRVIGSVAEYKALIPE